MSEENETPINKGPQVLLGCIIVYVLILAGSCARNIWIEYGVEGAVGMVVVLGVLAVVTFCILFKPEIKEIDREES